jgi:hypothetical protein
MSFRDRTVIANTIISELKNAFWEKDEVKIYHSILHIPYGYETHIPGEAQEALKGIYTKTSKHIRFTPDYIILQKGKDKIFLLEYKVTRTPRYQLGNKQWDYGQMEADAWENYINLTEAGIEVAVLIYCPYHSRPLLFGQIDPSWAIRDRTQVINSIGSGTPYVNIDLKLIPTFDEFMLNHFRVPISVTERLLDSIFFQRLATNPILTIQHHPKSPYNTVQYKTGFNWLERYK